MENYQEYIFEAVALLKKLVATPSISRDESQAAQVIEQYLKEKGIVYQRYANNILCMDPFYDEKRSTILLNAHIDTVKPVSTWTHSPFEPTLEGDRFYGLGTNDCGGGLMSLLQVYIILKDRPRNYNLLYLASAEEEVSGANGFSFVLPHLPKIDVAIVGEPTGMQPAIAEKGLMVIDGIAHGKSGHAARNEGINAIYQALDDLVWIRDYRFEKMSPLLGPTKMTVTVINAGTQHNVVPDACHFIIDVRTNEYYKNQEVFEWIQDHVKSEVKARSFRLNSSRIDITHPLVKRCIDIGMEPFGSPTLSDQALMPFPSLKLGPGQSSRSHAADEYICLSEINHAIPTYINILDGLCL